MKRVFFCAAMTIVFLLFIMQQAGAQGSVCAYYFYGEGCPACDQITAMMKDMESRHPGLYVRYFEVFSNNRNLELLDGFLNRLGMAENEKELPIALVSDRVMMGPADIRDGFEAYVAQLQYAPCPDIEGAGYGPGGINWVLLAAAAALVAYLVWRFDLYKNPLGRLETKLGIKKQGKA